MGGLLTRVIGGALKGAGDAMVEKAKQAREDALIAMAEQNKRADMKSGFDHEDSLADKNNTAAMDRQTSQQGFEGGMEDKREGFQGGESQKNRDFQGGQTDKEIAAHHQDVGTSEAGSDRRNAATIQGQKDVAGIRLQGVMAKVNENVSKIASSGGKGLTYNQAFNMAMQSYKSNLSNAPDSVTDADGKVIPANEWAANVASGYVDKYGTKDDTTVVRGGGLLNPNGGGSSFALGPSKLDPSNSAPTLSMPSSSGLTPPSATGTQGNGGPARLSQSDAKAQAQAAIAAGAPRASVIQRLKQNGYDTSGL